MPGLSKDPAKRRNQLDALARGRRALAQRVLADEGQPLSKSTLSQGANDGRDADRTKGTPSAPSPSTQGGRPLVGSNDGIDPGAEPVAPAASGGLGVPVHTYGKPPEPPKPPEPAALPLTPEQEAMTPTHTAPRPRALRSLFSGLRDGA
jgi:hypothetical protein